MGAWGSGSFENEDAQDFLGRLKSLEIEDLRQILARAADERDYMEARESSVTIAAAEVIAASTGAPSSNVPREIADWLSTARNGFTPDLSELARRAVNKVRLNSELKDLWLEAEGLNDWSAGIRDLEQMLANWLMNRRRFLNLAICATAAEAIRQQPDSARTEIAIDGDRFLINGNLTYAGRHYQGTRVEGLLMNARMVQGIFDDLNPKTRSRWQYPDSHQWDPERNTREFIAAMPTWRQHGLLSFSINFQGGTPSTGAHQHLWENSAFAPDGSLRAAYMERLGLILDRADGLGMAPIVGYFYSGQDHRLRDEAAVKHGVENATGWLLDRGYHNVLVEIANETTRRYHHAMLRPERIDELMAVVHGIRANGFCFPVGTSMTGGEAPPSNIVRASDLLLLHGNGVNNPEGIGQMIQRSRRITGYRPMPIIVNEDDHYDFARPANNMLAAIRAYASWGMLDQGTNDYRNGYQSPPVNWSVNTERKKAFFSSLKQITGA